MAISIYKAVLQKVFMFIMKNITERLAKSYKIV